MRVTKTFLDKESHTWETRATLGQCQQTRGTKYPRTLWWTSFYKKACDLILNEHQDAGRDFQERVIWCHFVSSNLIFLILSLTLDPPVRKTICSATSINYLSHHVAIVGINAEKRCVRRRKNHNHLFSVNGACFPACARGDFWGRHEAISRGEHPRAKQHNRGLNIGRANV